MVEKNKLLLTASVPDTPNSVLIVLPVPPLIQFKQPQPDTAVTVLQNIRYTVDTKNFDRSAHQVLANTHLNHQVDQLITVRPLIHYLDELKRHDRMLRLVLLLII